MTLRSALNLGADTPLVACVMLGDEPIPSLGPVASALRRVTDVHLVLFAPGRTDAVTATLRRAQRAGVDRVHAIGLEQIDDLVELLADADAGLIGEGFAEDARAFALYTQAGLPTVAPDSSAVAPEIARWKSGVVYPMGKVPELAKGLMATTRRTAEFAARIHEDQRLAARAVLASPLAPAPYGLLSCARVGVGPANYASQANEWARAIREFVGVDAESFSVPGNARRLPDRVLANFGTPEFHASVAEMETVLTRYSHLLVDAFMDVLGGIVADDIGPEIDILRRNGTQLGLIAHGSEIRLPQRHMDRIPHSYFRDLPAEWIENQTAQCLRNAATAAAFDGPVFVSTPGLLLDLPMAVWLPVVIPDPHAWDSPPAFDHGGPIRVLHRPSRSDPPVKGSAYIMPVLELLDAEGLIELVRAPEGVPPEQMPELIRRSDVLVDQIQSGSYGVATIEAMWAGRAVVGWVAPDVRALVPADVPIVDAAPGQFEEVMRDLVRRRDELPAFAEAGRAFAHEFHDGRRSAEALRAFVETPVRI